jgi:DNA polymerase III sliding clamp (beta) subunit (PCNA family)
MKKSELLKALEIVKPGLANKEVVDQATSFAFLDGRVVTYNDEISVSCPVAGLEIEGAVNAEVLYNYLKKIKKEDIQTEVTENEIILKTGRAKAGLVMQSEIKLPLKNIGGKKKWQELPENFLKALAMTVEVTERDASKPMVNSVHICKKGYIEGTDNYRFLRYTVDTLDLPSVLLPAASVREVLKFKPERVDIGKGWLFFQTGDGAELACRFIEDPFPDAGSLLNRKGQTITFPSTITNIIDRAQVFTQGDTKYSEHIKVILKDKHIRFESKSTVGRFEETANIHWDGNLVFTIAPILLKGILEETKEGILDGDQLLMFEGENWKYVAMLIKGEE